MRLLADECVYHLTIQLLRQLGHEVHTVTDLEIKGTPDSQVFEAAQQRSLAVITNDRDFPRLAIQENRRHAGLIVLRISSRSLQKVHTVLQSLLANHTDLSQKLCIVDREKYRIRNT